jgi:hypothetical protein
MRRSVIGRRLRRKKGRILVNHSYGVQRYVTLSMLLLVCGAIALSVGCTPIQYQPKEGIVDTLGVPQAQQRLKEVLLGSVAPKIDTVEITDDFLRYHIIRTTYEIRISFENVSQIDVFSNHYVFIWAPGKRILAKILFANDEDAKMFVDLVSSFRDRHTRDGSG